MHELPTNHNHSGRESEVSTQRGKGYEIRIGKVSKPTEKAPAIVDMSIFYALKPDYSILNPAYQMLDQVQAIKIEGMQLKTIVMADAETTIIMREVASEEGVSHDFLSIKEGHAKGFTITNKNHTTFHGVNTHGGMESNDEANHFFLDFIEQTVMAKSEGR